MKLIYYILCIIIFSLFTLSCVTNDHENVVTDNNIYFETISFDNNISRSDIIRKTSFETNDSILFISYGNHPNNSTLVYNGKEWHSSKILKWNSDSYDSIHYSAFYPASKTNRYTKEILYKNGMLNDILFCKSSNKYQEKISMKFKHIFSIVNIKFNDLAKKEKIQSIEISVPACVDSIEIPNGTIHVNNKTTQFTFIPEKNNDCCIIIPPIKENLISIKFITSDTIYEKEISPVNYKQGNIYTYNIIKQDKSKGIKTADDFIAFSFLINDIEYKDRSLDEFYYIENGKRIFSLMNDITFTEEKCQELNLIGSESKMFNDIFDGNEHLLSNLSFDNKDGRKALFGYIGEKGIVKNIHIENSNVHSINENEIALLAYKNYGLIDNCMINKCVLEIEDRCNCCFIAFINIGAIINTKVCNSTINANKNSSNCVISNYLKGKIINSYSSNNKLTHKSYSYLSGFVNHIYKDAQIKNCYVNCSKESNKNTYQYITDYEKGFEIENCFRNNKYPAIDKNEDKYDFQIFNKSFNVIDTGKDVTEMLNEWIDNNQIYYPEYKFKRWKRNTDLIPANHVE